VANHKGFDGGGYYYYSGDLQSTITWSGATFQFGPVPNSKNGQNNFVQAKGQSINQPQGDYGWLYLAGAGANGNQQNQQITLTVTDGSTATWSRSPGGCLRALPTRARSGPACRSGRRTAGASPGHGPTATRETWPRHSRS
jgi:hypothetical protein